ncbi:drug/metabolite transporter (DMT)-like permease [Parabacteroides sp. PF5-5]|uniref:DMT family transporter n=1 Tax=unclassified Parabacteroides TaxID=2649774 RepID=UPI002476DF2A|nr:MULTISPECIES: DMT family transporter [unclassified Parabacteroides]MDH6303816.1 drug/metabolite transporter (DMT)-like permease [Parabacteroides sp. PH5-39]MDH6314433.1 drug/metabolite transporter (DMT)-like permease [Parabacteroides sp. PF5-13]MDH6318502.1 drug/metabolite transporter (DMT)-like permease [Parabacteroides sp. PH5-13]MDH6322205.1 drug/metabolite transporter (DMT)-like permease [Parabacteroides sp. PH5-8]MDH6325715.1 drug/metabolite transporter (DMT)-like permease [Parabactero
MYKGEIISLGVAVSWTITALFFEFAGKRMGSLSLNIIRLGMAFLMLGITLLIFTGQFIPWDAGYEAWFWLAVSGFIGYVLGDYCLFSSYILIGSRFGQLFMTLSPPSAALAGMFILGERMNAHAIAGMFVTMFGIGLSIIGRSSKESKKLQFNLPLKGILFGIGAGVGQGVGLVFSKLGMEYYMQTIDTSNATAVFMVPFASTQIRAIVGLLGFLIIILWSGKGAAFIKAFRDNKAMGAATVGTFFGPFIGVSFSLMAVQYTEAGIASTLMALTPILILIPSYFFFKQKVTPKETLGAIISVIGVSLFFL